MAKKKRALKYFDHGKESQTVQAGAVLLVLGSIVFLYMVASKFQYIGY
jgi:hypothetical protein